MQKCIVKNLKQTQVLAKKFAKTLSGGTTILLSGDLGAGKTTFTQCLFKAMGVKEPVTSPTFTLLKEYKTKKYELYHFDMYRIDDENEASEFGLLDYFANENAINVVEWFEKVEGLIPKKNILIKITKLGVTEREFEFIYNE
ncbi:MAG: tRNA (adenosine(37)-N6)-threonylcarbamoyltransferase complex ATPase subunit type 1 TsaE [Clostridia bacterium]|jgi:tRNA threonylcarbamoyladenosine biosynthesis protein TsaE|nr:tRNA (adenosine(37)-N6)-threonylcarbamoyltransferase complex ATPase subunit type 1 TsaE [Clostridia bacterium]